MKRQVITWIWMLLAASAAHAQGEAPAIDYPPPTEAALATYRFDGAKTDLVIRTYKDGVAARFAHDHAIKAKDVAGELVFDPAQPAQSKISVTVQVASLIVDETSVRQRYGLPGAVSADDIETIRSNMLAEDQLWAEKFKTISFTSTSFQPAGDKQWKVSGKFTLRGVTKPVSLTVVMEPLAGGAWQATGKLRLKQSDFGYEPYSGMLGAVKNKDELDLHIKVVTTSKI
jgi:polyisoprenoid-binding protein YceI